MHEISGSRVLVTGGAGNIGSHVVDGLLQKGAAKIRVLDNFVAGHMENLRDALATGRVEIVRADVRDKEEVQEAMREIDYVFHEASVLLLEGIAHPRKSLEVNIIGTYNVLEAAVDHGIKKIVVASSASVFGNPRYLPVDEKHPFDNVTLYGATKIMCEQLCANFHHYRKIPYVCLRYYNVYGPRQGRHGAYTQVIPRWFEQIDAGQPLTVFGDGSQTMDLIFVKDIAQANLLALESKVANDCFNIGTGKETSVKELVETVVSVTGYKGDVKFIPHDVNLVRRRRSDPKKAQEGIGFTAATSVSQGIKEYVAWWQARRTQA